MSRVTLLALWFLTACATAPSITDETLLPSASHESIEKSLIVDCLLPGKIHKLGKVVYLTPRRPIKTSVEDCEIRGGEYVVFDRSNYATALKVLLPKAQAGDPTAQTYVGEIYEKGLGVTPDYTLAAQWYRRAAEQGYARAQVSLGLLYERGLGLPKDPATAISWYRKAYGLAEDEGKFASNLDEERKALRGEVASRQREVDWLRSQLADTQRQLKLTGARQQEIQQELEQTRRRLRELQESGPPPDSSSVQTLKNRVQALERQLEQERLEGAPLKQALDRQQDLLTAHQRDAKSREEALQEDIRVLRQQLESSKSQLNALEQERTDLQKRLQQTQSASEKTGFEVRLKELRTRIADLEAENSRLEKLRASREEPLDGLHSVIASSSL
jgi:hypothetical protein